MPTKTTPRNRDNGHGRDYKEKENLGKSTRYGPQPQENSGFNAWSEGHDLEKIRVSNHRGVRIWGSCSIPCSSMGSHTLLALTP